MIPHIIGALFAIFCVGVMITCATIALFDYAVCRLCGDTGVPKAELAPGEGCAACQTFDEIANDIPYRPSDAFCGQLTEAERVAVVGGAVHGEGSN